MKNYISIIYKYFPKNIQWGTNEYTKSLEYQNYVQAVEKFKQQKSLNFYETLKNNLPIFSILDWTNFELYNDREYKILLKPNCSYLDDDTRLFECLKGVIDELIIFESPLLPVYYILEQRSCMMKNKYIFTNRVYNSNVKQVKEIIHKVFEKKGYREITFSEANRIVPGINTELKDFGETTVFDCLFQDGVTILPSFIKEISIEDSALK